MSKPDRLFNDVYSMGLIGASNNFSFLGEGIARAVFAVNNFYAVKFAKNMDGIYQCKVENYIYKHADGCIRKYLSPILCYRKGMIFMRRALPLSQAYGIGENASVFEIMDFCGSSKKNYELYKKFRDFSKHYNLYFSDIESPGSWGYIDGLLYLIDYGCTNNLDKRYL